MNKKDPFAIFGHFRQPTLRQVYAAHALAGLIAVSRGNPEHLKALVKTAFKIADAMIDYEREEEP